jgi:hypothetical protein
MLLRIIFISLLAIALSAETCNHSTGNGKVYKARLETKALCYNYTLKLLEGDIDTSLINTTWTNESTNKTYTNVFALGNPCSFPSSIKEGDEFYFVMDTVSAQTCMVCMAFYPHPTKRLRIKVVNGRQ